MTRMPELVIYQQHQNIAVISMNAPPVNGQSWELRQAILAQFQRAIADDNVAAIILTSTVKTFCAGADIGEFGLDKAYAYPHLSQLCAILDDSSKLLVAAIDGVALGGGFELALACDYRVASSRAKFGLPEITLGIIPGAGGTQRLPRLAGLPFALDMILSGKIVDTSTLNDAGLIDKSVEPQADLLKAAIAYTNELLASGRKAKSCSDIAVDISALPVDFFAQTRASVARKFRGLFSPEQAIKALESSCTLALADGLALESRLVMECMETPQARALQHLFFAERDTSKIPGVDTASASDKGIKSVAVIGAGTMGSGIALNFLGVGIATILVDSSGDALAQGIDKINKTLASSVAKGRLSQQQADGQLDLLTSTTVIADIAGADLVIEAVIENMAVKQSIFRELGELCKPATILATNTSTLDVNIIAQASNRADRVVGMHFFSPANIMRLLEVVRGDNTSLDTLATVLSIAKKINKVPVVSGVCWGFIGNRMVEPYGREVNRLILEGVSPARIDSALTEFGLPMGMPTMIDMAGMDVGYHARQGNRAALYDCDPSYAAVYDKLYELGRYGQKSGRGFYFYNGREKTEDSEVMLLARQLAASHAIPQREVSDQEIVERTMFALINEGARILEEGIALRSGDIDIVYCFGYGFPNYRGGPMQYADEIGLDHVIHAINHYRSELGPYGALWFQPAPLLVKLAEQGKKFSDFKASPQ